MDKDDISQSQPQNVATPVVIYYREGKEAYDISIEEQRAECARFVKNISGVVLAECIEQGSGADNERPLLKAAAECAKRRGAIFLVADTNVLTREPQFGVDFCRDNNVRIAKYPNAKSSAFLIGFSLLQNEREYIKSRTRETLRTKIAKGEKIGRPKLKEGEHGKYTKHKKARKCEISSAVMEKIDTMHRAGVKPSKIAKVLNDTHQETARGGKWYTTTVTKVIKRVQNNK